MINHFFFVSFVTVRCCSNRRHYQVLFEFSEYYCVEVIFLTGCKLQTAREVYNKKRNEAQGGAVNVIIKRQYKAKKLFASLNNRRVKKKKKNFMHVHILIEQF